MYSSLLFSQEYNFFSDSDNSTYYDPSWLFKNLPSELLIVNTNKCPVDVNNVYSGSNSLKLQWTSKDGGDWVAAIASPGWVGWDVTIMDSISFWVYSPQLIAQSSLPILYLEDLSNQKTDKINLSDFWGDIPASVWTNIKLSLQIFKNHPGPADLTKIKTIFFGQSISEDEQHTLFIDELKITGDPTAFSNSLIVILGSSTAAGVGANPADSSWVNRFRNNLIELDSSYFVLNLAVGGYSTYDVMPTGFVPPVGRPSPKLNNNITYALQFSPKMILINLPSNDAAYLYSISESIINYDTLISVAARNDVHIFISTPQPRNFSNQSQLNLLFEMLDSTYSRYPSIYFDFWNGLAQSNGFILPQFNSGDGIHLNNAGHRVIYERAAGKVFPILVSTGEEEYFVLNEFRLEQNYPNPFNPSTVISYNLETGSWVSLKIYDLIGNEIATLVNEFQSAGVYSSTFNILNFKLSSGVYFYQLITGDLFQTKKMMILK